MQILFEKMEVASNFDSYRAVTDTHADVRVVVDGATFVFMEQLLVVEFAAIINRWLTDSIENPTIPFYYISMDEEEEPLLSFTANDLGSYSAKSCWALKQVRPLTFEEIRTGFSEFVSNLSASLRNIHDFDLRTAFRKMN
jgi:hypothetical protein